MLRSLSSIVSEAVSTVRLAWLPPTVRVSGPSTRASSTMLSPVSDPEAVLLTVLAGIVTVSPGV